MPIFNGTSGNDTMDYRKYSLAPPEGYAPEQAWLSIYGNGGSDIIRGSKYIDYINGGDGVDTIYGYNGIDYLHGGLGNDYLYGGNGNDGVNGNAGNDYLYGESGEDYLIGEGGNDFMDGGADDDGLSGGAGNDTMFGQAGDDVFWADAGADILDGGAGNDRLWGNSGNDQYQYDGQGFDYVNDGVTNTGTFRTNATYDTNDVLIVSYTDADLGFAQNGNDLWLFSLADNAADSDIDNAVIVEDFFLGGHHVVEYLAAANGAGSTFDLTSLL